MTLVYQNRMLFGTGEWSTPSIEQSPLAFSDAPIMWPQESTSPHVTLGNLNVELSAVSSARRWAEILTPRSVAAVCSTATTPGQDVLERLSASLKAEASRLLGESVTVVQQTDEDEVVFVVGYQPDAGNSAEERAEKISSLRLHFVQQIPEPHWGQISVFIEPISDAV